MESHPYYIIVSSLPLVETKVQKGANTHIGDPKSKALVTIKVLLERQNT